MDTIIPLNSSMPISPAPVSQAPSPWPKGLAYGHLNLRHNPFGQPSFDERADLAVVDIEEYLARLIKPGFALQLIGACGRGKSTHLHAIRRCFPGSVYVYVGEGERPCLPRGSPFLLDEAQRVPGGKRRGLFRRPDISLAIGTHVDLEAELRQAGLEVVTVRPAESLDEKRLALIVQRRIAWARRGPGPVPQVTRRSIHFLLERHGSDVRAMERTLYGALQCLEAIGDVDL